MSESLYVSFLLAEPGFEPGIQTQRQLALQNEHIHCATPYHQKCYIQPETLRLAQRVQVSHTETHQRDIKRSPGSNK